MRWYRQAMRRAFNKEIDVDSDNLVWTLHTSGYVPNPDTHAYVADLTNELPTAGGYTAGGKPATNFTRNYTAANAWTVARANSTTYNTDDVLKVSAAGNGFLYRCVVAGTTAAAAPAYPTILGQNVTDGTATFECIGSGITVLDCDDPSWAAATFTARYAVLSDRTPAGAAAQPLLGYVDFGANKSPAAVAFTITLHPTLGALAIVIP